MSIVSTPADIAIAAERLTAGNAALGIDPTDADGLAVDIANGDIVAIRGVNGVIRAHYRTEENRWYGSHIYGEARLVRLALAKDLAGELQARGHGTTPVWWQRQGTFATELRTRLAARIIDANWLEYTADEGFNKL